MSDVVSLQSAKLVIDALSRTLQNKQDEVDRLTLQLEDLLEKQMIINAPEHYGEPQLQGLGRQTAKAVLTNMIEHRRNEANALETFLNSLPADLSPAAEEALWAILAGYMRR